MELDLKNFLVLDIETVSAYPDYDQMSDRLKKLWDNKARFLRDSEVKSSSELYFDRAGIYAEFGKVITIAVGYFIPKENDELMLRVKDFSGHDEAAILREFSNLVETKFDSEKLAFCAHNGKEFDYPYLCRRMIINQIPIPQTLAIRDKKPWEVPHLDTMDLWKFGDRKNYTSLELLATLFDIDSSKSEIDGSMVNHVYHVEKELGKISDYCKQDVVVTAQVFLRLNDLPPLKPGNIEIL